MELSKAKELVIKAGKELAETGLIARTWGNVSCRTDENHFVITASGREYEDLTEDEIIELDIKKLEYEGEIKPSSEKKVHREIYRLREDVGFIIHTHQHNASAVSAMDQYRTRFDKSYKGVGDFVLCADYGLPGTNRVADRVEEAVNDSLGNAVLMRNHGAVCFGKTYKEAFDVANNLEKACGKYLESLGIEPWSGDEDHYRSTWNKDPAIMKYIEHKDVLPAYLDDFAQIVGPSLDVIDDNDKLVDEAVKAGRPVLVRGRGAMCNGRDEAEKIAISMIIEKNCRAALAGLGCKPISKAEALIMRQFYLQKYSKLKSAEDE